MKLNTKTKYGCVGFASTAAAFALIAMAMVCPGVDGVFAADVTKEQNITVGFDVKDAATSGDYTVKEGSLNVGFTVNPYIEISQNPQDVSVTASNPTSTGTTQTGSTPFAVRTNSSSGFDVYVSADNNLLSPADSSNPSAINPIAASNTALASFGKNTWGYAVTTSGTNPTSYRSITDNTKAYGTSTFSSSATNLQLNFGTKVDDTLPSDTYSTTVKVSAVLSGAAVASLTAEEPVVFSDEQPVEESYDEGDYDYSYDYDYNYDYEY